MGAWEGRNQKKFAGFVKSMQRDILTYSGLYITRRIIVNSGFSAHGTLISALQYIITERKSDHFAHKRHRLFRIAHLEVDRSSSPNS